MHTKYYKNMKGRNDLENLSVDERIILKWIEKKLVWTRFILFSIRTSGKEFID